MSSRRPAVLDACVLLNLIASGLPLNELAEAVELEFFVVTQVEREVLWLDPEDPDFQREEINLQELVEVGYLNILVLGDSELDRYVQLARELDDGEAATLAVAEARGFNIATDDRKALRVIATFDPPPLAIGTPTILRAWAAGRENAEVRAHLNRIERRASFLPPRSDPDRDWWEEHAK